MLICLSEIHLLNFGFLFLGNAFRVNDKTTEMNEQADHFLNI